MGILRLQSLKMLVVFLIPLLGFVHGTCWFDKLCREDELDGKNLIRKTKKENAEACQKECADTPDCKNFEFHGFQEEGDCYLLVACTQDGKINNPHYNAGPNKCPDITVFCKGIKANSKVSWHCVDKDNNELSDPTKPPVNSKCYTKCRGVEVKSECVEDPQDSAKWTTPDDEEVGTPDGNGKCECKPIDLQDINPNKEAGTLLHCKEPLTYCGDKTELKSENAPCDLFCYDIKQLSFSCEDGEWKTNIHEIENISGDDLYCYNQEDTHCDQE